MPCPSLTLDTTVTLLQVGDGKGASGTGMTLAALRDVTSFFSTNAAADCGGLW